jgi:hypothetical protein
MNIDNYQRTRQVTAKISVIICIPGIKITFSNDILYARDIESLLTFIHD